MDLKGSGACFGKKSGDDTKEDCDDEKNFKEIVSYIIDKIDLNHLSKSFINFIFKKYGTQIDKYYIFNILISFKERINNFFNPPPHDESTIHIEEIKFSDLDNKILYKDHNSMNDRLFVILNYLEYIVFTILLKLYYFFIVLYNTEDRTLLKVIPNIYYITVYRTNNILDMHIKIIMEKHNEINNDELNIDNPITRNILDKLKFLYDNQIFINDFKCNNIVKNNLNEIFFINVNHINVKVIPDNIEKLYTEYKNLYESFFKDISIENINTFINNYESFLNTFIKYKIIVAKNNFEYIYRTKKFEIYDLNYSDFIKEYITSDNIIKENMVINSIFNDFIIYDKESYNKTLMIDGEIKKFIIIYYNQIRTLQIDNYLEIIKYKNLDLYNRLIIKDYNINPIYVLPKLNINLSINCIKYNIQ